MEVMVVQSGQHRTTVSVEYLFGLQRVQAIGDFDDVLVAPQVGHVSIRQPATANQHAVSRLSIRSSTRSLWAPSAAAVRAGNGIRGASSAIAPVRGSAA